MSFVQDKQLRRWSMSRLIYYKHQQTGDGKFRVIARFEGGDGDVEIDPIHMSQALGAVRSSFAAEPGTKVLIAELASSSDEELFGNDWIWDHEVVGWAVTFEGYTRPITLEGVIDDYVAIEHPSGRIEGVGVDCDSRARLEAYLRDQECERRAKAATSPAS